RPRLFFPIVVADGEILISESLPLSVTDIRELARLLTSQAMLALQEGQIEKAIEHQLACHRLATLVGQQPTVIDALVSYAINAIACEADIALVASRKLSERQWKNYRQKIQSLPPLPRMCETIDRAERYI